MKMKLIAYSTLILLCPILACFVVLYFLGISFDLSFSSTVLQKCQHNVIYFQEIPLIEMDRCLNLINNK